MTRSGETDYEGHCRECEGRLTTTVEFKQYSQKRIWVRCGGRTGCGTITLLERTDVGSPDTDEDKTAAASSVDWIDFDGGTTL